MGLLADIAAALAAIPDRELRALRAAFDDKSVVVPQLLAWLDMATGWEINRRAGSRRELSAPRATIVDISAVECSLVTLAVLRARLRNIAGAANFFDVTADALCIAGDAGPPQGVH